MRDKELKGNSFGAKALVVLVQFWFGDFVHCDLRDPVSARSLLNRLYKSRSMKLAALWFTCPSAPLACAEWSSEGGSAEHVKISQNQNISILLRSTLITFILSLYLNTCWLKNFKCLCCQCSLSGCHINGGMLPMNFFVLNISFLFTTGLKSKTHHFY